MTGSSNTVFLTGFPGTLARGALTILSKRQGVEIELLVRKADLRIARKAIERLGGGVSIATGDIEQIDFGLAGKDYLALADRITDIVHLDPPVAPVHSNHISRARKAAREVIELGLAAQNLSHIIVLSHVDVAGGWSGVFSEQDMDLGQGFSGTASEDRFRAERVYRRFKGTLPVTVARAGWIIGRAPDLCPVVELLLTADEPSGLPVKKSQSPLYLSEVDGLAKAIAGLVGLDAENGVRTLHLIAPSPALIGDLAGQVRTKALSLVPEGFNLTAGARRSLRQVDGQQRWSAKDFFKQQPYSVKISTAFSERFLKKHDLAMPALDEEHQRQLIVAAVEKMTGFKR